MTTHAHHPSGEVPAARGSGPPDQDQAESVFARPRWLLPALAAGLVAVGLVAAGVVSLSTMLFIVAFGGMMLMHAGGHGGHGGHTGSQDTESAGHAGHSSSGMGGDRPGGSESQPSDTANGLDGRASSDSDRIETHDDDQHGSHSCH